MKRMVFILFMTINFLGYSQESAVDVLRKYGFTTQNVLHAINISRGSYSFVAKCNTHTYSNSNKVDKTETRVYKFEGNKNNGEKFTLLIVNDKKPSEKKIKRFNKEKNSYKKIREINLKDNDFFIKRNKNDTVVVGFNLPKNELSASNAYLSHLVGSIFIDKKSSKIVKIELRNTESFNLKIFHVINMIIDIDVKYDDEHKQYYVDKETTKTQVLLLDSITNIEMIERYSDYKFN